MKEKMPFYNQLVIPYHLMRAGLAGLRYGFMGRKMKVIGVTGTNGKTTTCFMIWQMLRATGYKVGVMTTVGWGVEKIKAQVEHMTTVDEVTLNRRMREIYRQGAEFLVLEVTSHALAQGRILGVPIEVAVMTNVTHEHLDYHGSFEKYRKAKEKLFRRAKFGVINADDKTAEWFGRAVKEKISYGIKKGELLAEKIEMGEEGIRYVCRRALGAGKRLGMGRKDGEKGAGLGGGEMQIRLKLIGEFNVYNSLAAIGVGLRLGLSLDEISRGLTTLEGVEGRMNFIEAGQDYRVLVDYAHTPDAFLKVFKAIGRGDRIRGVGEEGRDAEGGSRAFSEPREVKYGGLKRVITVTGGAGRRDETTREERGLIGGYGSEVLIITEDDTRDEDLEGIMAQFVKGAERAGKRVGKDLWTEPDRAKAIEMACRMAKKGDMVLILGKGHEKTILRPEGAVEFEDLKVAERVIRKIEREKRLKKK